MFEPTTGSRVVHRAAADGLHCRSIAFEMSSVSGEKTSPFGRSNCPSGRLSLWLFGLFCLLSTTPMCTRSHEGVVEESSETQSHESQLPVDCDCPSPVVAPAPAAVEPVFQTLFEGVKGDGIVQTFYPGLLERPTLSTEGARLLLKQLESQAKKSIPASPAPGEPKPPTMVPNSIPDDPLEPPLAAPKGFKDRHDLRIAIEPYFDIQPDGVVTIKWETWIDTPPSFVHFGLDIPDQILDYPRFRRATKESGKDRRKKHQASINLSRMETNLVDVKGYGTEGGTVSYRIEFLDLVGGINLFFDGRFAYTKQDGKYVHGVTILDGPNVDVPTTSGMTIWFETDVPTRAAIVIQDAEGEPQAVLSAQAGQHHELVLEGLKADTLYAYRVGAVDARGIIGSSGDYAFRTAPTVTRPFRFAFMSDSRSYLGGGERMLQGVNAMILQAFFSEAIKLGADFVLFPGDLVSGVTTEVRELELQFESWKRAVEPIHHYLPIFEGMGNHDTAVDRKDGEGRSDKASPNSSEEIFAREFVNPTNGPTPSDPTRPPYLENVYSFDYGAVHFVSINTNYWTGGSPKEGRSNREGFIMEDQMNWFEADLAAARERGASFIFVMTHEPGFPNGGHVGDAMYWNGKIATMNTMRTEFWRLASKYEVAAVLHGDEHNYSRMLIDTQMDPSFENPVWQIISGGGGAPYYSRSKTPWSKRVVKFTAQEHFVLVDVLSDTRAVFTVFGRSGELLDRFDIERKPTAPATDVVPPSGADSPVVPPPAGTP